MKVAVDGAILKVKLTLRCFTFFHSVVVKAHWRVLPWLRSFSYLGRVCLIVLVYSIKFAFRGGTEIVVLTHFIIIWNITVKRDVSRNRRQLISLICYTNVVLLHITRELTMQLKDLVFLLLQLELWFAYLLLDVSRLWQVSAFYHKWFIMFVDFPWWRVLFGTVDFGRSAYWGLSMDTKIMIFRICLRVCVVTTARLSNMRLSFLIRQTLVVLLWIGSYSRSLVELWNILVSSSAAHLLFSTYLSGNELVISPLYLRAVSVICLSLRHRNRLTHGHHLRTATMIFIGDFRVMLLFTHVIEQLRRSWHIWVHPSRLFEIFLFHAILSFRYFVNNGYVWHCVIAMVLWFMMLLLPSRSLIIHIPSRRCLSLHIPTFKNPLVFNGLRIVLAFCIGQQIGLRLISPYRSGLFKLTFLNLLLNRSLWNSSQIIQQLVDFLFILNFIYVSHFWDGFDLATLTSWWKRRIGLSS